MRTAFLFFILSFPFLARTQDQSIKNIRSETERKIIKDDDTTKKLWRKGGIYSLAISESSLSNWAAGGDNFSLSVNSLLSLYAFYKKDKRSWDNTFDFNLGYINTTTLGGRKNDDRFDLLSKYGYAITEKLSVAGLFNIRSQFLKGYTFSGNTKTLTSNFFAPGYILLGLGLDYKLTKNLSIFLSPITARWVIVKDTSLSNKGLYGVTPGKSSNFEFGAFASISYLKEFNKFIVYKGRLDLFSNYRHNPGNIDIYMSNLLSAKLGKVFAVSWSLDLIYDDDVRLFGTNKTAAATQLKSLVGIGLQLKFGK